MKLIQLQYFHAVCLYKSISEAARYLHVSQPGISFAIKELENEFGVTLFRRHYRGMVLTNEGEQLFKMCSDLLHSLEQTEKRMLDLGAKRKNIRLGIPPMIGSLLLSHIYSEFVPEYKDIRLDISEGGYSELMSLLSDDLIDMAFVSHIQPLDSRMETVDIADMDIICCVAKDNPLSELDRISPADLKDIPVVLFKDDFFQTGEIRKWFAMESLEPDILLQTNQLSTVQSIVSENTAAGFMFRQLAEKNPQLAAIPMKDSVSVRVSLVWKKEHYLSESMKNLCNFIKNYNPLNS